MRRIEAANVRHEHEWRMWEKAKLPAGKILIPGVVTHHMTTVEHPRLVADRIVNFARLIGRGRADREQGIVGLVPSPKDDLSANDPRRRTEPADCR
jgi:methionine synthase II (cobalamin-independent)